MEECSYGIKWGYYPDIFLGVVRKQEKILEMLVVSWLRLKLECYQVKYTAHFVG
jgi:hypothetical protein